MRNSWAYKQNCQKPDLSVSFAWYLKNSALGSFCANGPGNYSQSISVGRTAYFMHPFCCLFYFFCKAFPLWNSLSAKASLYISSGFIWPVQDYFCITCTVFQQSLLCRAARDKNCRKWGNAIWTRNPSPAGPCSGVLPLPPSKSICLVRKSTRVIPAQKRHAELGSQAGQVSLRLPCGALYPLPLGMMSLVCHSVLWNRGSFSSPCFSCPWSREGWQGRGVNVPRGGEELCLEEILAVG